MRSRWFPRLVRRRLLVALLLLAQLAAVIWFLYAGSLQSQIFAVILRIISICVALHVLSSRDKPAYKMTWLITVLALPLFGGLLYLICRNQGSMRRIRRAYSARETALRPAFPVDPATLTEFAAVRPLYETSAAYLEKTAGFPVYRHTQTEFYPIGEDFFPALLSALEAAERYIFLEYFILQEGAMWNAVLDILRRKAAAGVEVRVLYDDIGCFLTLPKDYAETLEASGIRCVVFNPFRPIFSVVQNNRDHRKIAVIDGTVAFTGGINLADEYINAYEKHGHWKDSALRLTGDAAWSLTLIFLTVWDVARNETTDPDRYRPAAFGAAACDGWVQPYADSPVDRAHVAEHVYMQMITRARRYLYITTPYLILDDDMLCALELAAESGVDVRIITPHVYDKLLVHITTRSYYPDLIRAGVRVYEYTPGFMHAKNTVADDCAATVSTVNMDFRSLYLHFEDGVRMYESGAVLAVKEDFLRTLEQCREITGEMCRVSPPRLFLNRIMRLFAPLL